MDAFDVSPHDFLRSQAARPATITDLPHLATHAILSQLGPRDRIALTHVLLGSPAAHIPLSDAFLDAPAHTAARLRPTRTTFLATMPLLHKQQLSAVRRSGNDTLYKVVTESILELPEHERGTAVIAYMSAAKKKSLLFRHLARTRTAFAGAASSVRGDLVRCLNAHGTPSVADMYFHATSEAERQHAAVLQQVALGRLNATQSSPESRALGGAILSKMRDIYASIGVNETQRAALAPLLTALANGGHYRTADLEQSIAAIAQEIKQESYSDSSAAGASLARAVRATREPGLINELAKTVLPHFADSWSLKHIALTTLDDLRHDPLVVSDWRADLAKVIALDKQFLPSHESDATHVAGIRIRAQASLDSFESSRLAPQERVQLADRALSLTTQATALSRADRMRLLARATEELQRPVDPEASAAFIDAVTSARKSFYLALLDRRQDLLPPGRALQFIREIYDRRDTPVDSRIEVAADLPQHIGMFHSGGDTKYVHDGAAAIVRASLDDDSLPLTARDKILAATLANYAVDNGHRDQILTKTLSRLRSRNFDREHRTELLKKTADVCSG